MVQLGTRAEWAEIGLTRRDGQIPLTAPTLPACGNVEAVTHEWAKLCLASAGASPAHDTKADGCIGCTLTWHWRCVVAGRGRHTVTDECRDSAQVNLNHE
jgi:hypothetical protein